MARVGRPFTAAALAGYRDRKIRTNDGETRSNSDSATPPMINPSRAGSAVDHSGWAVCSAPGGAPVSSRSLQAAELRSASSW